MSTARTSLLSLLILVLPLPLAIAQKKPASKVVNVVRGKSVEIELPGAKYATLKSVRVLDGRRQATGVTARLSKQTRKGRTLTIETTRSATPGQSYSLQGVEGRKSIALPFVLNITSGRQMSNNSRNQSNGRREPKENNRTGRTTNRDNGRKSKKASTRNRTGRNSTAVVKISPAGQRSVKLSGNAFRQLADVRVLRNNRPTKDLSAKLQRNRNEISVVLSASTKASLADYTMQGKIRGRWVDLNIPLSVAKSPENMKLNDGPTEYRPSEIVTLEDGTKVEIGAERPADGTSGTGVTMPTPVVTNWFPTKFANVGSTLRINGSNLEQDLIVRIGDVTLEITNQTNNRITVQIPDSSSDCPPGPLRIRRPDGTLVRSLDDQYFVNGDQPFHHVANTSNHNYANSFLMARLSDWVYNSYHSVNTWNDFKTKFGNKVRDLGVTEVEFIKPGNGPGDTEVAIVANPEMIIIVFRGSESPLREENGFKDWFHTNTDLDHQPVDSWQPGAWVHQGFYNAYNDVHTTLRSKVVALRNNGQPVFITGHSLGGSLATMAAYRLKASGIPIKGVYTYGSPRVGNDKWIEAYQNAGLFDLTQRWVNRMDFAPRYPPFPGWEHVGRTNNINMNGSVNLDANEVSAVIKPNSTDHSIATYSLEVMQELSVAQKNNVQAAAN